MSSRERAIEKAKRYMVRQCGTGNQCACVKAKAILASPQLFINAGSMVTFAKEAMNGMEEHPNKLPFKGILLLLDQASTKPPHGSRGHRILVPRKVAANHLESLIGMAVNYDRGGLDSHDTKHKVGIVTKAWITGNQVWVSGFVWKKDFPEAARDLKKAGLGMSMELANVYVRDEDEDVWHLEDFDFTGATILKKSAAAYFGTELAATATAVASGKRKGEKMAKPTEKRVAAASDRSQGTLLVEAMKGALSSAVAPLVAEIKASNDKHDALREDVEELKGLYLINAAKEEDDEDDDDEMSARGRSEDDEEAAREEDDEDDEDEEMSAQSDKKDKQDDDEEGDDEDLDAMEDLEEQSVDEEPGELNKDSKNKGDKTSVTKPPRQGTPNPGGVSEGRLKSSGIKAKGRRPFPGLKSSASIRAAAVHIATLKAQVGKVRKMNFRLVEEIKAQAVEHKKEIRRLRGHVASLEAQAEKYAQTVDRRSSAIPVEVRNLFAKSNIDPHEIMAGAAPPVPVYAVDQMFQVAAESGINIDTTTRATLKNRMAELGLMESGEMPYGMN